MNLLRMAALAACVAGLAAPSAALAQRYYLMRVDPAGMIVVDADTVDRQGDRVTMRDFAVPPAPVRSGSATLNYTSALTTIDCRAGTFSATDYIGYLPNGEMTPPEAGTAGFAPIEEGSARAAMRRFGCDGTMLTPDQQPLDGDMASIAASYRQVLAEQPQGGGGTQPSGGGK